MLGVFDSGVGGVTVLREIIRQRPAEAVLYFADSARLPYGTRSAEEICQFVREIMTWFSSQGVGRVLMACNTSSALALEMARREFELPVEGLIVPAARVAARTGRRIGVIATEATVRSRAYSRAIQAVAPGVEVFESACPEFVPLIESGRLLSAETRQVAQRYLQPLIAARIDTLVYGCTHYPFLAPVLDTLLSPEVVRVNPAAALVAQLPDCQFDFERQAPRYRFCVSGNPERFARAAYPWLDFYPTVESVSLGHLRSAQAF